MRRKNIYKLCKKNYDVLSKAYISKDKETHFNAHPDEIENAINQLSNIEYLKEAINDYKYYFNITKENIDRMDDVFLLEYNNSRTNLCGLISCMIGLYELMELDLGNEIGIDIKLPICNNFTDFKKTIDDLEFVITKCPFIQCKDESLQFTGVDIGSIWLTFGVVGLGIAVGSTLLNNIASLLDKAMTLHSHYLTVKKQKLDVEKAELDQKEKMKLLESIDKIYKVQADNAVRELEIILESELSDGDERGRAQQSMERLTNLLDKGLQIYSSIDAPQETKLLFEPIEMKYLSIQKEIKILEGKKED